MTASGARWAQLALAAIVVTTLWSVAPRPAASHPLGFPEFVVTFEGDGRFTVETSADLWGLLAEGYIADADPEQYATVRPLEGIERIEALALLDGFLRESVDVEIDGEPLPLRLTLPGADDGTTLTLRADPDDHDPVLHRGTIPHGSQIMRVRVSDHIGDGLLRLVSTESPLDTVLPLRAGQWSFEIGVFGLGAPAPSDGSGEASGSGDVVQAVQVVPTVRTGSVIAQYLGLGFTHIVPKGLDHILFVLGLFLLTPRMRELLIQVTAFTLAHTVTLALTIAGVIALPASVVEPLIALSIVYVAVENTILDEVKPWRVALVFAFGLLHGMGFAGVLSELGLPQGQLVPAVAAFNIGVELGQLAVVVAALVLTWAIRERDEYRRWVVIPASLGIGAVGLYWAIERVFG